MFICVAYYQYGAEFSIVVPLTRLTFYSHLFCFVV